VKHAAEEIEDLLAEYTVYLEVEKHRSDEWIETIEGYWAAHWSKRWGALDDITSPTVQQYISDRLREKTNRGTRVSTNTVRKELSALRGFLKWAKDRHFLSEMPTWETPEEDDSYEPLCLSPEEALAILEHLPTRDEHPKRMPVKEWYTFMWATSFRLGTMARLRWEDVNWKRGTIKVRAKADKRKYEREIPLTQEALNVLKSLWPGVGLIFGKHDYRDILRSAAVKAGFEPERVARITANHTFRHSRLTDLGERTTSVTALQYMAGHKWLETTQKYLHGRLKAAQDMLRDIGDGLAVDQLQDAEDGEPAGPSRNAAGPSGPADKSK